jgi:membrane protease YdiL (CAAX protease family)
VTEPGFPHDAPHPAGKTSGADTLSWLRPNLVASWREITTVTVIFVGYFAFMSTRSALLGSSSRYIVKLFSDYRLFMNCAIESVFLALFLAFLHYRGWEKSDFKIKPGWWSSTQGALLFLPTLMGNACMVLGIFALIFSLQTKYQHFLPFLMANSPHTQPVGSNLSWSVLLLSLTINAFFEELICTGYLFNQFASKHGPLFALLLIVLLRMSCHTYQGPVHMLCIGVVFLIYGGWYWYTRNLWTLIFAHAFADIISLGTLKVLLDHFSSLAH